MMMKRIMKQNLTYRLLWLVAGIVGTFMLAAGALAVPVLAQGAEDIIKDQLCDNVGEVNQQACEQPDGGISDIFASILQVLVFVVGGISVIVIIIAGIRFAVGGSDPQSTAAARNSIVYALVGIAAALFAQAIVSFVLNNL